MLTLLRESCSCLTMRIILSSRTLHIMRHAPDQVKHSTEIFAHCFAHFLSKLFAKTYLCYSCVCGFTLQAFRFNLRVFKSKLVEELMNCSSLACRLCLFRGANVKEKKCLTSAVHEHHQRMVFLLCEALPGLCCSCLQLLFVDLAAFSFVLSG